MTEQLVMQVVIQHPGPGQEEGGAVPVMIIGNNNVFEVGGVCHSLKVGDSNILEAKSYLGAETYLSR